MADLFYSFGIAHPGAITLHNFPRCLQEFERPDGVLHGPGGDGHPAQPRARRAPLQRVPEAAPPPPGRAFEELTDNPDLGGGAAAGLRRRHRPRRPDGRHVRRAETRRVRLLSDTAFRIFILMASRRLNSDRFFTTDYTPQVYTQAGLDWIDDNDMSTRPAAALPWPPARAAADKNAVRPVVERAGS